MNPTPDQQRPVLAIDLGASNTKVAWRPGWKFDANSPAAFAKLSKRLKVDGNHLIPSVAYDPGDEGDWFFGQEAARMNPGVAGKLHQNWKNKLFSPGTDRGTLDIATRFLGWLRKRLKEELRAELDQAKTRICIPELDEDSKRRACKILASAAQEAGWPSTDLLVTSEPLANVIGLASAGKNRVNVHEGHPPEVFYPKIYGNHSPLMRAARYHMLGAGSIRLVVIDIGAYTTDFAVCELGQQVDVRCLQSVRLGVSSLDATMRKQIEGLGLDPEAMSLRDFEQTQRSIYNGSDSELVQGKASKLLRADLMADDLNRFADLILKRGNEHFRDARWFVITGGGAEILPVRERLVEALGLLGLTDLAPRFPKGDQRFATALGGASVMMDFDNPLGDLPTPPPLPPRPCSCGGNKDCMRCIGGVLPDPPTVRKANYEGEQQPILQTKAENEPRAPGSADPCPAQPTTPPEPKPVRNPKPRSQPELVTVEALINAWNKRTRPEGIKEFTLEGWRGKLVFASRANPSTKQFQLLTEPDTSEGKAAWLRLLCLGALMGIRTNSQTFHQFWSRELKDFWEILIPEDPKKARQSGYQKELDAVFQRAIHRQFNDQNASGENAELWRRVFYDFRKLHHFVYINELPSTLLELAQMKQSSDSLVNFLRSGKVPGSKNWVGAIGQSMNSPLFFILRELRRLQIIADVYSPCCFYLNSTGRRVACQLGWINAQESSRYDFENLIKVSEKCFKKMKKECPELLPYFDLPLHWYAENSR